MSETVVAEVQENKIHVTSYDPHIKDRILSLPGARWNRELGVCVLNLSWAACKQLRAILGERFEIGDGLYQWAMSEVQSRIEPCLNLRQATQADLKHPVFIWLKEQNLV